MREARKAEQLTNPHYLRGNIVAHKPSKKRRDLTVNCRVEDIPMTKLDLAVPLKITGKFYYLLHILA